MGVRLAVALLVALAALSRTTGGEENPHISIKCPSTKEGKTCTHFKVATEYTVELECTTGEHSNVTWVRWLHPNGTDIGVTDIDRMTSQSGNTSATLTIHQVIMDDNGNFTCVTSHPGVWAYMTLEPYIMPNYFVSGMVILGINMALCVLFIACMIRSVIRQRKLFKQIVKVDNKGISKSNKKQLLS